jgi:hypothetical protein
MSPSRKKAAKRPSASPKKPRPSGTPRDLVILTGLSGSGKASALKAFEDLGFYAVDNMPVMLMRPFAELVAHSRDIRRAALVVDVREGQSLEKFPAMNSADLSAFSRSLEGGIAGSLLGDAPAASPGPRRTGYPGSAGRAAAAGADP